MTIPVISMKWLSWLVADPILHLEAGRDAINTEEMLNLKCLQTNIVVFSKGEPNEFPDPALPFDVTDLY